MDYEKAFKTEVIRPALTLLTPGIVACAPIPFLVNKYHPNVVDVVAKFEGLATFLGLLVAFAAGLLMHELGSRIETFWIDARATKADPEWNTTWYQYLRCTLPPDSVARDYIETLVFQLNFELNMTPALLACWGWLFWLYAVTDLSGSFFLLTSIALIVGAGYLTYEANSTAHVLGRVRKELLKGIGTPPVKP